MNTNDLLHVSLAPPEIWSLEWWRIIGETLALMFAGAFFIYKLVSGYFFIDLSLNIRCDRKHSPKPDIDMLLVCVKLKKGERGSLRIHDAQARISYTSDKSKFETVRFSGFERSSYKTETIINEVCGENVKYDRKQINWTLRSKASPFLRLAAGEETEYACAIEVPRYEVCLVEVAILGRKGVPFVEDKMKVGQWKASSVSLPIDSNIQQTDKAT